MTNSTTLTHAQAQPFSHHPLSKVHRDCAACLLGTVLQQLLIFEHGAKRGLGCPPWPVSWGCSDHFIPHLCTPCPPRTSSRYSLALSDPSFPPCMEDSPASGGRAKPAVQSVRAGDLPARGPSTAPGEPLTGGAGLPPEGSREWVRVSVPMMGTDSGSSNHEARTL